MMQHKYPFTMLHFHIEPDTLDVNVHPTKMELRLPTGEKVYHAVLRAVSNALAHKELIPRSAWKQNRKRRPGSWQRTGSPPGAVRGAQAGRTLSQKTSGSPLPRYRTRPSSGAGSVYTQSAPPRPSFVNELMPDWLKERRKEQENVQSPWPQLIPHQTENTVSAGKGYWGRRASFRTDRLRPDRPGQTGSGQTAPGQDSFLVRQALAKQFPARQPTARQRPVRSGPGQTVPSHPEPGMTGKFRHNRYRFCSHRSRYSRLHRRAGTAGPV